MLWYTISNKYQIHGKRTQNYKTVFNAGITKGCPLNDMEYTTV
jgi:hypothetical protein